MKSTNICDYCIFTTPGHVCEELLAGNKPCNTKGLFSGREVVFHDKIPPWASQTACVSSPEKCQTCDEPSKFMCKGPTSVTNEPKEPTEESMRLAANEALLSAKSFMLFVVSADGSMQHLGDVKNLNPAEHYGFISFCEDRMEPPCPYDELGDGDDDPQGGMK